MRGSLLFLSSIALVAQPGPTARQTVDSAAAARGKKIYLQSCINCHGSLAQGTDQGPDLVRSVVVLHDKLGSELTPALQKLANHKKDLKPGEVADISHFLKDRVEYTAQDRNASRPPNVLTGNASAGKQYFEGTGKCGTCHSLAGDFAKVAGKYPPDELQQRFLFPRRRPISVSVRAPGSAPVTGTLDRIDDFSVSLKDAKGEYHSWQRGPTLQVELNDPLAAHHELLDQITDPEIHNVVAYLETLK
jgi:mono/diheme cytochrome c family protein